MRTAAMVLGIVGGVVGIFASFLALIVGGVASAMHSSGGGEVVGLGYAAFFVSVVAIVGGALAAKKPVAASVVMFITCIAGFICISAAWLLSGPLLLIGAILALVGRKQRPEQPQHVQYVYAPILAPGQAPPMPQQAVPQNYLPVGAYPQQPPPGTQPLAAHEFTQEYPDRPSYDRAMVEMPREGWHVVDSAWTGHAMRVRWQRH